MTRSSSDRCVHFLRLSMIECSESILTSIDVFVVINILSNRSKWTFIFYKVFKLILQSATLIILIIMANIFQVLGQQYNAVIMWLLFFVVAAFVSYRILKTIEKDIKSLPDKVKAAWKADIWGGYALLFNLIVFLLYLAHYVNWDEDIKFIINLLK